MSWAAKVGTSISSNAAFIRRNCSMVYLEIKKETFFFINLIVKTGVR